MKNHKLFYKERLGDHRKIYFLGIKIFSYKKTFYI